MPPSTVAPDLASAPAIVSARGIALGRTMNLLTSTSSTNDDAKRGARAGAPHGTAWVAETQTAGRGRRGRSWLSAPGENLLFSVLLRDGLVASSLGVVPIVAGLAVAHAVERATGAPARVKWPNDVLVREGGKAKKVAGVLVEAITQGARVEAVVVGVGVNVHARAFPADIADRATSVVLTATPPAPPPDRARILADTLEAFDRDLTASVARGLGLLRARLDQVDALRGKFVRSDHGDEGIAAGIDDSGALLVRRDGGALVKWLAGEVHLTGEL